MSKNKEVEDRKMMAVSKNEDRFYRFFQIITQDFDKLIYMNDPYFLRGLELNGLSKMPNSRKAKNCFNRYIKTMEFLQQYSNGKEEKQYLEFLLKHLKDEKSIFANDVIDRWKIADEENKEQYDEFRNMKIETLRRIIKSRMEKMNIKEIER